MNSMDLSFFIAPTFSSYGIIGCKSLQTGVYRSTLKLT